MIAEAEARKRGMDDIAILLGILDEEIEPDPNPIPSPMERVHGKAVSSRFEAYHDVTVYEDGYEDWSYIGD